MSVCLVGFDCRIVFEAHGAVGARNGVQEMEATESRLVAELRNELQKEEVCALSSHHAEISASCGSLLTC